MESAIRDETVAGGSNRRPKLRRSHTGCQKCRQTKVKCDEARPHCGRCSRLRHDCDYSPRPRKKYTRKTRPLLAAAASEITTTTTTTNITTTAASGSASGSAGTTSGSIAADDAAPSVSVSLQSVSSPGSAGAASSSFSSSLSGNRSLDLSSVTPEAASVLDPLDHAALHYFHFVMPASVDGKTPKYSGPAVCWELAQKDVMVMHAVCAHAGRKFCEKLRPPMDEMKARKCLAVEHCATALGMLNSALQQDQATNRRDQGRDLDNILCALWMLLTYEQCFGDGSGLGFSAHLRGAAAMYKGRIGSISDILSSLVIAEGIKDNGGSSSGSSSSTSPDVGIPSTGNSRPTSLTCQLMVWIGLVDTGAAINGLGGIFCRLLGESHQNDRQIRPVAQLEIFRALQRRADMSNFELWGAAYPQDELVDDLQNSQLMGLQAECGQLRYLLSYLAEDPLPSILLSPGRPGSDPKAAYEAELHNLIRDMGTRYGGILKTAGSLRVKRMESPSQRRFTISVRHICAFFHAAVLCYLRLVRGPSAPFDEEQRGCLREIMKLAHLAHRDNGEDGMVQFAWALFVVALETDDSIHRSWILERMEILAGSGENFRRAFATMRVVFSEQGFSEKRVDYFQLMRREDVEKFVLT